jgi:hypothetical protein
MAKPDPDAIVRRTAEHRKRQEADKDKHAERVKVENRVAQTLEWAASLPTDSKQDKFFEDLQGRLIALIRDIDRANYTAKLRSLNLGDKGPAAFMAAVLLELLASDSAVPWGELVAMLPHRLRTAYEQPDLSRAHEWGLNEIRCHLFPRVGDIRLVPAANTRSAKGQSQQQKRSRKRATANEQMLAILAQEPDTAYLWTLVEWSEKTGFAQSTINDTKAWDICKKRRADDKHIRMTRQSRDKKGRVITK